MDAEQYRQLVEETNSPPKTREVTLPTGEVLEVPLRTALLRGLINMEQSNVDLYQSQVIKHQARRDAYKAVLDELEGSVDE